MNPACRPEVRAKISQSLRTYWQSNPKRLLSKSSILTFHGKSKPSGYAWILRATAIRKLGGKCVICGEKDVRILEFNHLTDKYGNLKATLLAKAILRGEIDRSFVEVRCANHNILYEYEIGRRKPYCEKCGEKAVVTESGLTCPTCGVLFG